MPDLPTPQAYLEQSALLLQAYPDSRITTKYSFPSQRPSSIKKSTIQARKLQQKQQQQQQQKEPSSQSQPQSQSTTTTAAAATTPVALLTLKTYNPTAGICLKYRTTKAAEVGRLITSLGKLAAGADVASLGLSAATAAAPAAGGTVDVEMTDAPAGNEEAAAGKTDPGAKGGKSKKKGKGKR